MSAGHSHAAGKSRRQLWAVLIITTIFMLVEAAGGYWANSLALLADAGHMLTDVAATALALFAMWFAARPRKAQETFGFHRAEILAALLNGVTLLGISVFIGFEAIERFSKPETVNGIGIIWIAMAGLLANIAGLWFLRGHDEENLNMRGVSLHILTDLFGQAGAIVAGLLVWLFNWHMADPILSLLIAVMVLHSAWRLVQETVNVLLEVAPAHIQVPAVETAINEIEGVEGLHDLHIWSISSSKVSLTAHMVVDALIVDPQTVLTAVGAMLNERFHISHTTIQIETAPCSTTGTACFEEEHHH